MPPAKKAKAGRPAATKEPKPAPQNGVADKTHTKKRKRTADTMSDASEQPPAKAPGRGRGRKRAADEQEEEDNATSEAPPTSPAAKPKGRRGRPKKVVVDEAEPQPAASQKGRKPAMKTDPGEDLSEIPETQQPDAEQSEDEDEDDEIEQPSPQVEVSRSNGPTPSSPSKRPIHTDSSDPALRRRLGELTQKHEALELKYRDLREIGVKEAERNFDKLRKQSEEKSKAADQLIAALKSELAAQKEASKEIQRLKKQLEASESKADSLQARVTELTTSLSDSKSEIKSLNLKLTAARNAEAAATAAANKIVPGSAMKKGGAGAATANRLAAGAASEAIQQAMLAAQKKEDLYGDLTGLIVRSVKREDGEDRFDCLQTGRNGTLHFKLAIEVDGAGDGEAHCHYTPQLDANRDRALIAVLPGFLVDEISFPQAQAGKFYARVLKALNEQPEGS
ncbi:hypothetical protein VTK26DRAFT_3537 [Humicola hyalothermophila]